MSENSKSAEFVPPGNPASFGSIDAIIWPHIAANVIRTQYADIERLTTENERLKAEAEALRQDAERWRIFDAFTDAVMKNAGRLGWKWWSR